MVKSCGVYLLTVIIDHIYACKRDHDLVSGLPGQSSIFDSLRCGVMATSIPSAILRRHILHP